MSNNHPTRSTNRERDERFFHLRNVNVHYDDGRCVRDVTAFTRRAEDGTTYVSFAECDERDQFNRKRGRTVARRKWFSGKRYAMPIVGEKPSYDLVLNAYTTV